MPDFGYKIVSVTSNETDVTFVATCGVSEKKALISTWGMSHTALKVKIVLTNLNFFVVGTRALILVKVDQFLCLILPSRCVVLTATRWPSTRRARWATCTRCLTSSLPFLSWAGHCLALSKRNEIGLELLLREKPFIWIWMKEREDVEIND